MRVCVCLTWQELKQEREYEKKLASALRHTTDLERTHARLEEELRAERAQLAAVEVSRTLCQSPPLLAGEPTRLT